MFPRPEDGYPHDVPRRFVKPNQSRAFGKKTGWSQFPNFGTPKYGVCRSASPAMPGHGRSLRRGVRQSSEIEPDDGVGDVGSHPVGVGLVVEGHGVGQGRVVMEADASYGVAL